MNKEPDLNPPNGKKSSPALALAFFPSVMFLAMTHDGRTESSTMEFACFVSIVCCFTASVMLFQRNSALAVSAGVIFLLLNLAISFLFGCGATFSVS
jgi:hypothetical protein